MNDLVTEIRGRPVTSSRKVAKAFGKNHDDILKNIRKLEDSLGKISEPNLPKAEIQFYNSIYKSRGGVYAKRHE